MSLDLGDYLVEGRRVGMISDGTVDVIGEVAYSAMEPGQDAEGVGEPAFSVGAEAPAPVQSSGGHGVAGRALDVGGGRADFAGGQVAVRTVEVTAAVALVGCYGSDGGYSFALVGWLVGWLIDCGRQDFSARGGL